MHCGMLAPQLDGTMATSTSSVDKGVAGTAAFSKFMRVLQLVADSTHPLGIADIAKATGYPRPTAHRIVAALQAEGMVAEVGATRSWVLGPRLIQLASRSWSGSGLRMAAAHALRALRDETGETIHFAVPSGHSMVYIDKLESPSAVQMSSRIGTSVNLYSTAVGKAYLAALAPAAAQELMVQLSYAPLTANTVKNSAALQQQVDAVRAQGWSTDAQENEEGIYCFGAAVLGLDGCPVAAISVSTLLFRQKDDVHAAYIQPLLNASRAISAQLAQNPNLA